MPCFGFLGTTGVGFWWILPLVGLLFMALMFFVCFRGFRALGGCGCMGGRWRAPGELSDLQHEIDGLKEDVRKLVRQPN